MAVSDSSSSLNDIENDSILMGSVYSSSEVTEEDSSSVASLSLSVGIIRPYCFEPECLVELEASSSSETEEYGDHPGEERLGNTTWYVNQIYVESTDSTNLATNAVFYVSLKFFPLSTRCMCGYCKPMPMARESICCQEIEQIKALLVDDPAPACITLHGEFSSACLCRTVLTIAYHSHRHHYGNSSIPTDENR